MGEYITLPVASAVQKTSSQTLEAFVNFYDSIGAWHPRDFRLPLHDIHDDVDEER